jgi:hypothetical protein
MSVAHRPLSFAAALALLVSVAGCATREAPPPGVIVPPTPIGSIDASSSHWRAISRVGAPPPGTYQVEWTARGLVVLSRNGAGGIYDPYKDAWRAVVIGPGTPAELPLPAAVSEGSILYTGNMRHTVVPRALDLASATWRAIPEAPAGSPIYPASAWTGSTLFVWGGSTTAPNGAPTGDTGDGAILDVASGAWRSVAREGAPSPRARPAARWTGSAFFVWGGVSRENGTGLHCSGAGAVEGCVRHADGALYDPVREQWSEIPAEGAPPLLRDPRILWTGSVVLLWDQAISTSPTTLYAYDPPARRWRAPLVMPVAYTGSRVGVSGGRVIFLDQTGGHTLDVDAKVFSPVRLPEDIRDCWPAATLLFEAARLVVISPARCHGGTLAVSAFDPRHGTWKTASLPPVPRREPTAGVFNGQLAWTGEHLIAWGDTYQYLGPDTSCLNPPNHMGCDPVGPSLVPSNEGYILRPSL